MSDRRTFRTTSRRCDNCGHPLSRHEDQRFCPEDDVSDKIGPDGLTDEEVEWRTYAKRRQMGPSGACDRLWSALVALGGARLDLAAERLAHARTRAERDRLRAKMDDVLRYGHGEQCGTSFMRPCTCTFRIAHDALSEVKP